MTNKLRYSTIFGIMTMYIVGIIVDLWYPKIISSHPFIGLITNAVFYGFAMISFTCENKKLAINDTQKRIVFVQSTLGSLISMVIAKSISNKAILYKIGLTILWWILILGIGSITSKNQKAQRNKSMVAWLVLAFASSVLYTFFVSTHSLLISLFSSGVLAYSLLLFGTPSQNIIEC